MSSEFQRLFILHGKEPCACPDAERWAEWMEGSDRTVGHFEVGDYVVSTVFLGLTDGSRDGMPLLFETLIFFRGAPLNHPVRATSWEEAEQIHSLAVKRISSG